MYIWKRNYIFATSYVQVQKKVCIKKTWSDNTEVAVTPNSNIKLYFHHKRGTSSRRMHDFNNIQIPIRNTAILLYCCHHISSLQSMTKSTWTCNREIWVQKKYEYARNPGSVFVVSLFDYLWNQYSTSRLLMHIPNSNLSGHTRHARNFVCVCMCVSVSDS